MSAGRHTVLRSMHDLGLGLAGRTRLNSTGWATWAPVQAVATGAHLTGPVGMARADRGRAATTVLTAAATGTTPASRLAGARTAKGSPSPAGATEPSRRTPDDVAEGQAARTPLPWITPALTSGHTVLAAQQGERHRTAPALQRAAGRAAGP